MKRKPRPRLVVTNEIALEAMLKYLLPLQDFHELKAQVELHEVIQLVNPGMDEWVWNLDEETLADAIKGELLGDGQFAEGTVTVGSGDADVGDGSSCVFYSVLIDVRVKP